MVQQKSISVIGNINAEVVAKPIDALPAPGTETFVDDVSFRIGGNAGNTGIVLSVLGGAVRLHGSLGDDTMGRTVASLLSEAGVDLSWLATIAGSKTTITLTFESGGRDRCFVSSRGHLDNFSPEQISESAFEADLVLITGYFATPLLQGTETIRMLDRVHLSGGTTFFDPGSDPDGWSSATLCKLVEILHKVDYFLPNLQELRAIGRSQDLNQALERVQEMTGGRVIVKLGPQGSVGLGPRREGFHHPARIVDSADTSGAGDSFNAGLLYGLASGLDWSAAAALGVRLASEIVGRPSHSRYLTKRDFEELCARAAERESPANGTHSHTCDQTR